MMSFYCPRCMLSNQTILVFGDPRASDLFKLTLSSFLNGHENQLHLTILQLKRKKECQHLI